MKTLLSALFVVAAAANFAMAADKPDFSGDWKLDADKSSLGPMQGMTESRKIDHKDPDLTVNRTQSGPNGDMNTTSKYSTDGKETTNSMMGNDVKSKANWDGSTLVIVSNVSFQGTDIKVTNKWKLSDDGKTLTDDANITGTPQGDLEMTYVFVKQ